MSLPAWTNDVGVKNRLGHIAYTAYTYDKNGNQTSVKVVGFNPIEANSVKATTDRTKVRFIDGMLPFRDPTSYTRKVANLHFVDGDNIPSHGGGSGWTEYYGCSADRAYQYLNPNVFSEGSDIIVTDAHNQCIVECLLKLGEHKAELLQAMAESVRAAKMLTETWIEMMIWLKRAKQGRLPWHIDGAWNAHRTRFLVDRVTRTHLQWKYGWLPLARDLHQQFNVLKDGLRAPHIVRASRTVRSKVVQPSGSGFTGFKNVKYSVRSTDRCVLWGRLSDENFFKAQSIGLTNPLSLAWEVIPYSFVVDWFMPVGNILQALSATYGLSFVAGFHSQTRELQLTADANLVGSVEKEAFVFSRKKYNTFPSALKPYAKNNPFRGDRLATAFSLLAQLR